MLAHDATHRLLQLEQMTDPVAYLVACPLLVAHSFIDLTDADRQTVGKLVYGCTTSSAT